MANTLITPDMVLREALEIAHEKASFIGTVRRDYDESFAKGGAKIGDTLKVRNPNQYTRRQGSRVMDVQEQAETTQTITVATQDGVDMRFNSAELALDIDDFSQRYIEPAVSMLVSAIDGDFIEYATQQTFNLVGTPGTVVGDSGNIEALGQARALLNRYLAPKSGNRAVQIDSMTMAKIVNGTKSIFHDGTQIKEAFREGFISRNAMADWYENERTYVHTVGADVTTVAINDGSLAEGDSGFTISGATIGVGEVFTLPDVYAVHPETKAAYSHLQQFTVLSVSGNDITFAPAIYSTGAKQNVNHFPTTADTLTFVGTAGTAYRQNLMYHKDAFTFVTADLPIMDDAHKCVRRVKDGISMRVWQGSDIRNDELLMRIDILYGMKALRPEWACRITN